MTSIAPMAKSVNSPSNGRMDQARRRAAWRTPSGTSRIRRRANPRPSRCRGFRGTPSVLHALSRTAGDADKSDTERGVAVFQSERGEALLGGSEAV